MTDANRPSLDAFAPLPGEAAVLSALLFADGQGWTVACGSLLCVPEQQARISWPRWGDLQPSPRERMASTGLDLGPVFCAEPFAGIRIVRAVLAPAAWPAMIDAIIQWELPLLFGACRLPVEQWSSRVFIGTSGLTPAHALTVAAQRPLSAVIATLESAPAPPSENIWQLALPKHVPNGQRRARMYSARSLPNWPQALLGVRWPAGPDHAPPPAFLIGRTHNQAWIADVVPDFDNDQLGISIAWDADAVDPLGCSLLIRNQREDLSLLTTLTRVSDLPSKLDKGQAPSGAEARRLPWSRRLLTVDVPRGARRTDWGVTLFNSAGQMLDEQQVAPRVEQIALSFTIDGAPQAMQSLIGDQKQAPNVQERDETVDAARTLDRDARQAAARRRLSTAGELTSYLRWRLSARAGELLILDLYLTKDRSAETINFLLTLDRPIRALVKSISTEAAALLKANSQIQVRALSGGRATLHDRIWLFGETGLLVGGSTNTFIPGTDPDTPATTATEMPAADAAQWRNLFEQWWKKAK